jgi:hypothetical protein
VKALIILETNSQNTGNNINEISAFHGGEDVDDGLLDCDAIFSLEDGGNIFLQKIAVHLQVYMALQPRHNKINLFIKIRPTLYLSRLANEEKYKRV